MKALFVLSVLTLLSALFVHQGVAQSSYDLRSPDGRIEVRIRTAERLR